MANSGNITSAELASVVNEVLSSAAGDASSKPGRALLRLTELHLDLEKGALAARKDEITAAATAFITANPQPQVSPVAAGPTEPTESTAAATADTSQLARRVEQLEIANHRTEQLVQQQVDLSRQMLVIAARIQTRIDSAMPRSGARAASATPRAKRSRAMGGGASGGSASGGSASGGSASGGSASGGSASGGPGSTSIPDWAKPVHKKS
jgi:uncharacterized membrane protein YgcG